MSDKQTLHLLSVQLHLLHSLLTNRSFDLVIHCNTILLVSLQYSGFLIFYAAEPLIQAISQ